MLDVIPMKVNADYRSNSQRCAEVGDRQVNQNRFRLNQNGFTRYDHQASSEEASHYFVLP
jgi:hypothetical protein